MRLRYFHFVKNIAPNLRFFLECLLMVRCLSEWHITFWGFAKAGIKRTNVQI